MDNIYEIKFSFEQKVKDAVISVFSNKQGGSYNVFSYHWQCFVWAAVIGFLRNKRRPLIPPLADKPFSLSTMLNNGGEQAARALICLVIARVGTVDIMKTPTDAINLINEYANEGFYHIITLLENPENTFNDLERVKQEIFSRNYDIDGVLQPISHSEPIQTNKPSFVEIGAKVDSSITGTDSKQAEASRKYYRWSSKEEKELVDYYKAGMTISQLAQFFKKDEDAVREKLQQKRLVKA